MLAQSSLTGEVTGGSIHCQCSTETFEWDFLHPQNHMSLLFVHQEQAGRYDGDARHRKAAEWCKCTTRRLAGNICTTKILIARQLGQADSYFSCHSSYFETRSWCWKCDDDDIAMFSVKSVSYRGLVQCQFNQIDHLPYFPKEAMHRPVTNRSAYPIFG